MSDMFLKFEGGPDARGESLHADHTGEISVFSFSWGATNNAPSPAQPGGGAASIQDFHVTKNLDRATAPLFQACCSGAGFRSATFTVRSSGQSSYVMLQCRFEDVLISSYQIGGSDGSPPMDQLSIQFAKCSLGYRAQSPSGAPEKAVYGGWDIVANKPSTSPIPMR